MTTPEPESTAVRVALWRAMHLDADAPPPVFDDPVGLAIADPPDGWRDRGDMHPEGTKGFRAWIVARARYIEDLLATKAAYSPTLQYVLLGAGLDTFAQRHPERLADIRVFEVDQPEAQAWKRQRLIDLGYGIPPGLSLVPVDFETNGDWPGQLDNAGFARGVPAFVASTGVSMYLTKEANLDTLRQVTSLGSGTTLAMTFQLTLDLIDPADQPGRLMAEQGAQQSGTPFISFFSPEEMLQLARDAGFADVQHVSSKVLTKRYFLGRPDGLRPSTGEDFLIATV